MNDSMTIRIAACAIATGRFAGRAELQRKAKYDGAVLAELEAKLGINTVQARAWRESEAVEAKRADRKANRLVVDVLAAREPGHIVRVWTKRVAKRVIAAAGIRTTTHGHTESLAIVTPGNESAEASTCKMWPSSLGLPNSYKYQVSVSDHAWFVSSSIVSAEVQALNASCDLGLVYLSETARVKQGRGTSLVTQKKRGGKWS